MTDLEKKQYLKEIKDNKKKFIHDSQNLSSNELLTPTIDFLEKLNHYRGFDPDIDRIIQQYWKLASDNIRIKKIEEETEKEKGR